MISAGVPLGTPTPDQVLTSNPGMVSPMVGTFGSAAVRAVGRTASARTVPALMCGKRVRQGVDPGLNAAGDEVGHHRRAAGVRHVHEIDAGRCLEQLERQMTDRARAERRGIDLARIGLRMRDELGDGLRGIPGFTTSTSGSSDSPATGAMSR